MTRCATRHTCTLKAYNVVYYLAGAPQREHLPAEEEPSAGYDGPGSPLRQREPAALRARGFRHTPILLVQYHIHRHQHLRSSNFLVVFNYCLSVQIFFNF